MKPSTLFFFFPEEDSECCEHMAYHPPMLTEPLTFPPFPPFSPRPPSSFSDKIILACRLAVPLPKPDDVRLFQIDKSIDSFSFPSRIFGPSGNAHEGSFLFCPIGVSEARSFFS